jgi:hypothetical protein
MSRFPMTYYPTSPFAKLTPGQVEMLRKMDKSALELLKTITGWDPSDFITKYDREKGRQANTEDALSRLNPQERALVEGIVNACIVR